MIFSRLYVILCALLFVLNGVSWSVAEGLKGLVSELDDESFQKRERASGTLYAQLEKNEANVFLLRKMYQENANPEVLGRLYTLLRKSYERGQPRPFLGVTMMNLQMLRGGRNIGAVQVGMVVKNSAAEDAGLVRGDVILSIDGVSFGETNKSVKQGLPSFKMYTRLQKKRVGEIVTLSILRIGEEKERSMEIALMAKPENLISERDKSERERDFKRWLTQNLLRE